MISSEGWNQFKAISACVFSKMLKFLNTRFLNIEVENAIDGIAIRHRKFQSLRSVTAGSTRPALRAGPSPARKAVTSNNAGAIASAKASEFPTPYN
jgi:hypothetical protein